MLDHKIVVLTDLHMLKPGKRILDMDPADRLAAAVSHINSTVPDAARVIVTGDLTHWGDDGAYLRLRDVLEGLKAPLTLALGNHDRRATFLKVFPEVARDANGFVQSFLDIGGYRLIVLDTLDDSGDGNPAHHYGVLCAARRQWLAEVLAGAAGRPAAIFMHHPPFRTGFTGMDGIRLRDGDEFYELISRAGNVKQIICGHVHRSISGAWKGVPFAIFKSTVDQQPFDFELTDTKLSVKEPGEFGVLLLTSDGIVAHGEDF